VARKGTNQGKAKGQEKAKRKASKVKDLPAGSRTARSVKGGSFTGNLNTGGNRFTLTGSVRNMNTV
jgi:hypothetical protein